MAKRKRMTSQEKTDKLVKAGKGQGKGAEYLPWLTVQDVASQGLATRVRGYKTRRVHHLLSKLETNFFCLLELSPMVTDIREQYPLLPLEETLAIANACGVRHPTDPQSQEPVVMTTDFVITCGPWDQQVDIARTIKYCQDMESTRVIEKLEIERRYWQSRKIDWGIVTEREMPPFLVQNCRLLRDYLELPESQMAEDEKQAVIETLFKKIQEVKDVALKITALECDRQLGLPQGTSLAMAYHLVATRQWQVDWQSEIDPASPLVFVSGAGINGGEIA